MGVPYKLLGYGSIHSPGFGRLVTAVNGYLDPVVFSLLMY